jgi:hypothetical protein
MTAVLFRSEDIEKAGVYYATMLGSNFSGVNSFVQEILPLTIGFLAFEWIGQHKTHPFDVSHYHPWLRRTIYVGLIICTLLYGYFGKEPFYYFQF